MRALLGLLTLCWCGLLAAHPLAPALLELKEDASGRVEVLWRASMLQAVGVEPRLPAECRRLGEPDLTRDERGAMTARWTVECPGGLTGRELEVPQLERAGINVILRIERAQGPALKALLDARRPAYVVPPPEQPPAVFPSYLQLGVEHLLFGPDHLLFVVGLVLLVRRPRRLLLTVTAFTLGHSLTLSLAVLGFVRVNSGITELGIALSILLLACELARPAGSSPGWLSRWPASMAIAFGLLHGLGFAGALASIGLPPQDIPLALFAFNLGIELGQVLLVLALLALGRLWQRPPERLRLLPIYSIGSLAVFWCLERVAALGL